MRTLRLVVCGSLLTVPAVAAAEAPDVQGWMESDPMDGRPIGVRQVLPSTGIQEAGATQIIYLNKNGATLTPSDTNDSRVNRSTLVGQTTAVPAWNTSAANWQAVVDCTRTMWAPFNVIVTDVDPGNVPHMEAIFTTQPGVIGFEPNVGGVSPYTIGCDVIPNSIVFTFAEAFGGGAETVCEVMAQEVAHSYGVDHELLASDPMTYLQYNGLQSFKDQTVSCGESTPRNCGLQGECGANQNSYQMLMQIIGPGGGGENGSPSIAITSPSEGAEVPPGFTVVTSADDDSAVTKVELWVDGVLTDEKTTGPFSFETSSALAEGPHQVQTIVYDDGGLSSTDQINVTIAIGAPDPGDGGGGGGGGDDTGDPADLVGGCQAGGGQASLVLLGLAALGLVLRRRR